jgi:hypothetical protein
MANLLGIKNRLRTSGGTPANSDNASMTEDSWFKHARWHITLKSLSSLMALKICSLAEIVLPIKLFLPCTRYARREQKKFTVRLRRATCSNSKTFDQFNFERLLETAGIVLRSSSTLCKSQ